MRSLDGVEAVVPNETLVTTIVLNHSCAKREIRLGLPVQVAHDTDIDLALKLMEAAARAEPRVLKNAPNPPAAILVRFAESGIDLELGVWIDDPDSAQLDLRSALNRAIWRAFQAHGIRIPFPQRELRVVGASGGPRPARRWNPSSRLRRVSCRHPARQPLANSLIGKNIMAFVRVEAGFRV